MPFPGLSGSDNALSSYLNGRMIILVLGTLIDW